MQDVHPELDYQLGTTPQGIERARDHSEFIRGLEVGERPRGKVEGREGDPKWRYFWRLSEDGAKGVEQVAQVVPAGFERWAEVMDGWGGKLMRALRDMVFMLEIGLNLERGQIWSKFKGGPHLLAPTGTDLNKYGRRECVDKAIARVHYDLNALTIHGKSRFPGLFIWTKEGKRVKCQVPEDCLLVQAGKQIEWITGGLIRRGMHEVVITEETVKTVEEYFHTF